MHLEASGCTELYIGTGSDPDPHHMKAAPQEAARTELPMSRLKMWLRRCSTGQGDHAVGQPTAASPDIQHRLSDLCFQQWSETGRDGVGTSVSVPVSFPATKSLCWPPPILARCPSVYRHKPLCLSISCSAVICLATQWIRCAALVRKYRP